MLQLQAARNAMPRLARGALANTLAEWVQVDAVLRNDFDRMSYYA